MIFLYEFKIKVYIPLTKKNKNNKSIHIII